MTKPEKYAPKHRAPGKHKRKREPWTALRTSAARPTLALTGLAVAFTGTAVATGVVGGSAEPREVAVAQQTSSSDATQSASLASAYVEQREEPVTRSDRREQQDPAKAAVLASGVGIMTSHERKLSDQDPRDIARTLLTDFGFADSQFSCLDKLWTKESRWRWNADNPSSSAYGIPQALPGSKMSTAGEDWETNPATQITWGLGYIKGRYGNPCAAWSHSQARNWY